MPVNCISSMFVESKQNKTKKKTPGMWPVRFTYKSKKIQLRAFILFVIFFLILGADVDAGDNLILQWGKRLSYKAVISSSGCAFTRVYF